MDLIVLDTETYYSKEYSLSKITTEEYIRSNEFEVIGVAVKVNDGETHWASGTHEEIAAFLNEFDWGNSMLLCQNTAFDGAILNWLFGIKPKAYADTMCMSKAMDGVHVSASLKAQTERHLPGHAKGTEVIQAMGLRRCQFSEPELSAYGDYCINDVELTYKLFKHYIRNGFPKRELKVVDMTIRMYVDARLELDSDMLESHLEDVKHRKSKLLDDAGVTTEDLMSANKFAQLLRNVGIEPPTKISAKTGKESYAFAKTDEGFKALQDHPNGNVQALVAARLGNKSTLEETRTERFIDIARRGALPGPVGYYGAHTGRWSGFDKINLQNLPSRGPNAKTLKNAIMAPDGYVLVEADLSQIEARVLAWLSGQQGLVDAFARGEDVYVDMASKIYGVPPEKVTKEQRSIGKTAVLGAGFGMGAKRFRNQLKAQANVAIDIEESLRVIRTYRETYRYIKNLWRQAQDCIESMYKDYSHVFSGVGRDTLTVNAEERRIYTPTGLSVHYPDLHVMEITDKGPQYGYKSRKGVTKIYGGLLVENIVQHLARLIIAEHMMLVQKRYHVALTVHDSILSIVPEHEAEVASKYIYNCMHYVPDWAKGLPLDCELGYHKRYGKCGDNAEEVTQTCAAAYKQQENAA